MNWTPSSIDNRVWLCIGVAVVWLAAKFGKSAAVWTKTKAIAAWSALTPKVQSQTTIVDAWPILAVVAGLYFLSPANPVAPTPVVPVVAPDQYSIDCETTRTLLADKLDEFIGKSFDSTEEKQTALDQLMIDIQEAGMQKTHSLLSDAFKANNVSGFTVKLRAKELR